MKKDQELQAECTALPHAMDEVIDAMEVDEKDLSSTARNLC